MRLRQLLLFLLWLPAQCCFIAVQAQKQLHHQVTVVSENDNYAFTFRDRYYTNGMMLRYVRAAAAQPGKASRLFTAELGQQIFTPYRFNLGDVEDMDRPFTGYLYLKAIQTRFYPNGALLQWGGQFGVIGEKAFGKEVQRWHHRNFRLKFPYGWETQLKTGIGFNAEGRYVHPLLHLGRPSFGVQVHGNVQGQVGNLFIQGGGGALLRIGRLQQASRSAAFDARMLQPEKKVEWYFFYEPQLIVQAYNATLQGGLRQQVHNPYTTTPRTFVLAQKAGFALAPRQWGVQLAFSHKGREATTMRHVENWGSVALAFRW